MAEMSTLPMVTAKNYFDPDIEMAYMGSTQVKNFMRCEAAELARLKGGIPVRRDHGYAGG